LQASPHLRGFAGVREVQGGLPDVKLARLRQADNDFLDWFDTTTPSSHAVFGKVTSGMEIVNKISRAKCDVVRPDTTLARASYLRDRSLV
jgi:cyclophilin family peptidyl-prolyl cis-trans isomerase